MIFWYGDIAQLGEHPLDVWKVAGSSPVVPSQIIRTCKSDRFGFFIIFVNVFVSVKEHEMKPMKIILSPAKKMRDDMDYPAWEDLPALLDRTQKLLDILRGMSRRELQTLWACNDAITDLNRRRLLDMDLRRGLTPAILAYDGIQYQYMAPQVFEESYYAYVQEHVRILSGFYGILKPLDGVTPYRLEMQARLATDRGRNLYEFWGDSLYRELTEDEKPSVILNLASAEYSRCIRPYLRPEDVCITCVFGQMEKGRIREKGVYVKMARGEMARYLAEHGAREPEEAKTFDRLGFRYHAELSDAKNYVFLMQDGF